MPESLTLDVDALKDASDVEGLIGALDQKFDWKTRSAAADALGEFGDGLAVESLIRHLDDDDDLIAERAAVALARIGTERAVEVLIARLDEGAPKQGEQPIRIAQSAVYAKLALAELAPRGSIERLIAVASAESTSNKTRVRAMNTLARMSRPEANAFLRDALSNALVRHHAVQGMGDDDLGFDSTFVQPLIALLGDSDWQARGCAASALGGINDPAVIEPLVHSLEDDVYDVRRRVVIALGRRRDPRTIGPLQRAAARETANPSWILTRVRADFGDMLAATALDDHAEDRLPRKQAGAPDPKPLPVNSLTPASPRPTKQWWQFWK